MIWADLEDIIRSNPQKCHVAAKNVVGSVLFSEESWVKTKLLQLQNQGEKCYSWEISLLFVFLNIEKYTSDNFYVSYKKDRLAAYILHMILPLLFISSFSFCFGILCIMQKFKGHHKFSWELK